MSFFKQDYHYDLPENLIGKAPLKDRTQAKMLVLNKQTKTRQDRQFSAFPSCIEEGSLLVFNDTKVIPARLLGAKESGAKIEVVLIKQETTHIWRAMIKGIGRLRTNEKIILAQGKIIGIFQERVADKEGTIYFEAGEGLWQLLEQYGFAPLPPYIAKHRNTEQREFDRTNYQTVFAKEYGAIAAPTAGLHFTKPTLDALQERNVSSVNITLHVGLGTFEPMLVEDVREHAMHFERYSISPDVAAAVNQARKEKRNVVAIGTTTARTLESAFMQDEVRSGARETNLFIYPPYEFNVVTQMLTNFHLPCSTLLMMISAFAGKDYIMQSYEHAVKQAYRFYSYGDCMLIQ